MRKISVYNPRGIRNPWFNDFFEDFPLQIATDMVEIEMYETDNDVVIKAKAPGFKKEDFDISIEDNTLTISATAQEVNEEEDKSKKYFYKEISQSSISRSVSLPVRVKADAAEANYTDGILQISVPKAEEVKPKKISVSTN